MSADPIAIAKWFASNVRVRDKGGHIHPLKLTPMQEHLLAMRADIRPVVLKNHPMNASGFEGYVRVITNHYRILACHALRRIMASHKANAFQKLLAQMLAKWSDTPPIVLKCHPCRELSPFTINMLAENRYRVEVCRTLLRLRERQAPGRYISRKEACRIAQAILEGAERERLDIVEAEAARGVQYPDED